MMAVRSHGVVSENPARPAVMIPVTGCMITRQERPKRIRPKHRQRDGGKHGVDRQQGELRDCHPHAPGRIEQRQTKCDIEPGAGPGHRTSGKWRNTEAGERASNRRIVPRC